RRDRGRGFREPAVHVDRLVVLQGSEKPRSDIQAASHRDVCGSKTIAQSLLDVAKALPGDLDAGREAIRGRGSRLGAHQPLAQIVFALMRADSQTDAHAAADRT